MKDPKNSAKQSGAADKTKAMVAKIPAKGTGGNVKAVGKQIGGKGTGGHAAKACPTCGK